MEWLWLKMLGSLLLIVVLIVGTMWLLKKFMSFSKPAQGGGIAMEVAGVLHLGPRRAVYAVKAGSQVILLGVAEHAVTYLTELSGLEQAGDGTVPARQPVGVAAPFFTILKDQFMRSAGVAGVQPPVETPDADGAVKKTKAPAGSRKKAAKPL